MINFKKDRVTRLAIVLGVALMLLAIAATQSSAQSIDEYCLSNPNASFCSGDSVKECFWGLTIPEDEPCPEGIPVTIADCPSEPFTDEVCLPMPAVLTPDEINRNNCELDGSCDDSCTPPARGDCLIPQNQPDELPATGTNTNLLILGIGLITLGVAATRVSHA